MEKGARFPTTEVMGYCQMSLRDMNAMYFLQIGGLHPMGFARHVFFDTFSLDAAMRRPL